MERNGPGAQLRGAVLLLAEAFKNSESSSRYFSCLGKIISLILSLEFVGFEFIKYAEVS